MTLDPESIEGKTLTCCVRPRFPFPLNVGLELGQFHRKTITKQHWKRERQVSEQRDPSEVSLIVNMHNLNTKSVKRMLCKGSFSFNIAFFRYQD